MNSLIGQYVTLKWQYISLGKIKSYNPQTEVITYEDFSGQTQEVWYTAGLKAFRKSKQTEIEAARAKAEKESQKNLEQVTLELDKAIAKINYPQSEPINIQTSDQPAPCYCAFMADTIEVDILLGLSVAYKIEQPLYDFNNPEIELLEIQCKGVVIPKEKFTKAEIALIELAIEKKEFGQKHAEISKQRHAELDAELDKELA
jgi:hypothetical protein